MIFNIVRFIHYLLIAFAIFVPLLLDPDSNLLSEWLLVLHSILMPGIIIHWLTNNNICSLTVLESYMTNQPLDKTFIASILFPFFEINNCTIHVITLALWFISLYKLYYSQAGFRLLFLGLNNIFQIKNDTSFKIN